MGVKITATFCQQIDPDNVKTRMTTFNRPKFKISDDQTNIDKYRIAANITEYQN